LATCQQILQLEEPGSHDWPSIGDNVTDQIQEQWKTWGNNAAKKNSFNNKCTLFSQR